MTMFPHRYRLQFGADVPGPYSPEKAAFRPNRRTVRETAQQFLAFRRAAQAADQSVDAFMRRGDTRSRFYYFGEGETP
jgi:hypothetical protein